MEENQTHIPEGWFADDLGNLIKEKRKSSLKVSDAANYGEFPFFTSGEAILKHTNKQLDGNNIFLATGGVANIKYYEGDAAYSTDTYAITTKEEVDTEYLYFDLLNILYYINANYFQGSGLKHLQKKDLKKHQILLPKSKTEQTQIATILSKVDEAITQTEQLIAKYTHIKTGLMQDFLTKGIDENGNIRSEETHEFKDSPLGRIPTEWECLTIGDVAERLRSGVTPKGGSDVYQKEGIMLIRSQNVYSYGFKLNDIAYISEEINSRMLGSQLETFDVLLNITGASIGRSTFVPVNHPLSNVNQHVCSIRIKNTSLDKAVFLSSFLNSIYGQNQIQQNNAGSNREGINYNQIRAINIPWFSNINEFSSFKKIVSKATEKIDDLEITLSKLKSLKTGLMQDLLSGKVRVNHLIKETANV
ncbi:MAG: restriction endonuclease subunit S [Bacteroidetes bacterium]|nr:restriction endonuclease subunit S [Bacteroidota bacterium]